MNRTHVKRPPMLFPAMGSPMESEIRRVEFDMERGTRSVGAGEGNER